MDILCLNLGCFSFPKFTIISILRFSFNTQTPKWVVSFENSLVSLCCTGSNFSHGFLAVIVNWIQTGSIMSVGLSYCDFWMFLILFLTRVSFRFSWIIFRVRRSILPNQASQTWTTLCRLLIITGRAGKDKSVCGQGRRLLDCLIEKQVSGIWWTRRNNSACGLIHLPRHH